MIGSYKKVKGTKSWFCQKIIGFYFFIKKNVDIAIHILTIYNRTLFIINNKTVLSKCYFYGQFALTGCLKQTIYAFEFTYHKLAS